MDFQGPIGMTVTCKFDKVADANRYIEFLRKIGLGKRQIELVSGDPDPNSKPKHEWCVCLSETNMSIKSCSVSRNYGSKSSLSIRPNILQIRELAEISPAAFRFIMAMAFIVFGECPSGID